MAAESAEMKVEAQKAKQIGARKHLARKKLQHESLILAQDERWRRA